MTCEDEGVVSLANTKRSAKKKINNTDRASSYKISDMTLKMVWFAANSGLEGNCTYAAGGLGRTSTCACAFLDEQIAIGLLNLAYMEGITGEQKEGEKRKTG